jgi:hypothetical protein
VTASPICGSSFEKQRGDLFIKKITLRIENINLPHDGVHRLIVPMSGAGAQQTAWRANGPMGGVGSQNASGKSVDPYQEGHRG